LKKRRQRSPSLHDVLRGSDIPIAPEHQVFVSCAARSAFVTFLRGVLGSDGRKPRGSA